MNCEQSINKNIQLMSFTDNEINDVITLFYQYLKKSNIIKKIDINELSQLTQYLFKTFKQYNKYYLVYNKLQKTDYNEIKNILINNVSICNQEILQDQNSLDLICKNLSVSTYCVYFLSEFYNWCKFAQIKTNVSKYQKELLEIIQKQIADKSFLNKDFFTNNTEVAFELDKLYISMISKQSINLFNNNTEHQFLCNIIWTTLIKINCIYSLFYYEIQNINQYDINDDYIVYLYQIIDKISQKYTKASDNAYIYGNIFHTVFCIKNEFNNIFNNYKKYFQNKNNLKEFIENKFILVGNLLAQSYYDGGQNCKQDIIKFCDEYKEEIKTQQNNMLCEVNDDYSQNINQFLLNNIYENIDVQQLHQEFNEKQIENNRDNQLNYSYELLNNYQQNDEFINLQENNYNESFINQSNNNNESFIEQQNNNESFINQSNNNNESFNNDLQNIQQQYDALNNQQLDDKQDVQNENNNNTNTIKDVKNIIKNKIYNIYNKNRTLIPTGVIICCGIALTVLFALLFKKIKKIIHNSSNNKKTSKKTFKDIKEYNTKTKNKLNKKIFKHINKFKKKRNWKTFRNIKNIL